MPAAPGALVLCCISGKPSCAAACTLVSLDQRQLVPWHSLICICWSTPLNMETSGRLLTRALLHEVV